MLPPGRVGHQTFGSRSVGVEDRFSGAPSAFGLDLTASNQMRPTILLLKPAALTVDRCSSASQAHGKACLVALSRILAP